MADNIKFSYTVNDSSGATAYRLNDGFANTISGLATARDAHASGATWYNRPVSQQEIEASYRGSWVSRKAHEIPALDMVRPWRTFQASTEQVEAIEKEERRLNLKKRVKRALIFARMYGGAAIMIGITGDNPSEPLDVTRVKKGSLAYLHVLTRHEVTVSRINMDPGSPTYGEPLEYIVTGGGTAVSVDPSRMVRFTFGDLPDQLAFASGGWGDPLLMSIRDALVNADTAQGSFAALTTKARTSTWKVPGLLNMVSTTEGEQKFIAGAAAAARAESMFNTKIISAPMKQGDIGEDWENQQVNFSGVPAMGDWFIQQVAAAANIPMTKFGSISPGGLNSTGDGDEANYLQMLDAGRELDLRPALEMIDEVLIRSALGNRPPEIWFQFEPFEVDSETTKATNSKVRADGIKALAESGTVPSEVLAKAVKGVLVDSGEYPGVDEAYRDYEAAGEVLGVETPEADNDNSATLNAAIEGLSAQGKSASVAARDAIALCDSVPRPLYVSRMVLNREEIQAWATEQGLGELQPDLHATILYSKMPVDWISMGTTWADKDGDGSGKLQVTAGGPRCVELLGDRTAVLMFSNTDMQWRHEEMVRAGASHDYNDFTLHISLTDKPVDLSKVVPYRGVILFGPELFQEIREDAI